MRIAFGFGLLLFLGVLVTPAQAAAPIPIGYWVTDNGAETLLIQPNMQCSLQVPASNWIVGGSCSWDASSNGGILTIMNVNQYQPAPIYLNVVWIDDQTISVEGDILHRQP